METIIVIACLLGLLVYFFWDCKKSRAKNEAEWQKKKAEYRKEAEKWNKKKAIEKDCKEGYIEKMIELLEKGVDPNQRIEVWDYICDDDDYSVPPRFLSCCKIKTLLDITYDPAAKKLLRAYGAKTIREICAEEEPIEKAREEARVAEEKRQEAIRQAEKKAKEEAKMQKVEAFLASKKA